MVDKIPEKVLHCQVADDARTRDAYRDKSHRSARDAFSYELCRLTSGRRHNGGYAKQKRKSSPTFPPHPKQHGAGEYGPRSRDTRNQSRGLSDPQPQRLEAGQRRIAASSSTKSFGQHHDPGSDRECDGRHHRGFEETM